MHRRSGSSTAMWRGRVFKLRLVLRILTIALRAIWTFLPIVDLVVIGIVWMTVVVLVIGIPPTNEFKGVL